MSEPPIKTTAAITGEHGHGTILACDVCNLQWPVDRHPITHAGDPTCPRCGNRNTILLGDKLLKWDGFWKTRFKETDEWLSLEKSSYPKAGSGGTSSERNPGCETGE